MALFLLTVCLLDVVWVVPPSPTGWAGGNPPGGAAPVPGLARVAFAGNSGGVCSTSGSVYLGVDWNCVAILNLVEVGLMLAAILLVAYIYWDSDAAELPGESASVPLTEEEWAANRALRAERLRAVTPDPEAPGESP
ncbi:MAG: hypothetical protein L3K19_03470 [Thermoplasmata archaeon]|nr:hypothetical protein [Thermoplasmata archaeon]